MKCPTAPIAIVSTHQPHSQHIRFELFRVAFPRRSHDMFRGHFPQWEFFRRDNVRWHCHSPWLLPSVWELCTSLTDQPHHRRASAVHRRMPPDSTTGIPSAFLSEKLLHIQCHSIDPAMPNVCTHPIAFYSVQWTIRHSRSNQSHIRCFLEFVLMYRAYDSITYDSIIHDKCLINRRRRKIRKQLTELQRRSVVDATPNLMYATLCQLSIVYVPRGRHSHRALPNDTANYNRHFHHLVTIDIEFNKIVPIGRIKCNLPIITTSALSGMLMFRVDFTDLVE